MEKELGIYFWNWIERETKIKYVLNPCESIVNQGHSYELLGSLLIFLKQVFLKWTDRPYT